MMDRSRTLGVLLAVFALAACNGGTTTTDGGDATGNDVIGDATDTATDAPGDTTTDTMPPQPPRTAPTNGSAIVISSDDHVAVAANRFADSVSVFNLGLSASPPTVGRTAQLSTGAGSRPWAVVIGNDNNTAYAILRGSRQVIKITNLNGTPAIDSARANTGSEPTGLAITPTGARLYVANWVDGTVTVVNTADMSVVNTIDLNASLAGTGLLGSSVPATGRPALAHPRAIVITNNGDSSDDDETVYVTEFFSQARTSGVPTDDSQFDQNRQGLVYRFNVGTGMLAAPITLSPIADTGFQDTGSHTAGCFPNQLYAAALNHNRLYVSSVCASPRGPAGGATANFKTEVFALISVIDTSTNAEVPTQSILMNQRWQSAYDTAMTPDTAARRMPLIVNDIQFIPMSSVMYVPAYGSDAVFRVALAADGSVMTVGSSMNMFIDLAPGGSIAAGQLPIGLGISSTGQFGLALNAASRNVSLIQFSTQSVINSVASADAPTSAGDISVNDGRRFFVTGLGRWSLNGQAWNSCEACHGDGLTDNVTWFFARGPRQTTSLDGTYAPDGMTQRFLNWTAINDEVHDFELNTRGNSGGVGAVVHANSMPPAAADRIIFDGTTPPTGAIGTVDPQPALNGSVSQMVPPGTGVPAAGGGTALSVNDAWARVDSYVRTIAAPHAPTNVPTGPMTDADGGAMVFQNGNCAGCHGGPDWTISRRFYTPGQTVNNAAAMTGSLRGTNYMLPAGFTHSLNPPAALTGVASLRRIPLNPMDNSANDQINCVLRAVGTFPATPDAMNDGIAPSGVTVREVRADMTTVAQGSTGYNPPSLFGMATGAPYFHAGNARTLEEAFTSTFASHHQSLNVNFLMTGDVATQTRQLVAFLLSIDERAPTVSPMTGLSFNPDVCPATFP